MKPSVLSLEAGTLLRTVRDSLPMLPRAVNVVVIQNAAAHGPTTVTGRRWKLAPRKKPRPVRRLVDDGPITAHACMRSAGMTCASAPGLNRPAVRRRFPLRSRRDRQHRLPSRESHAGSDEILAQLPPTLRGVRERGTKPRVEVAFQG